MSLVDGLRRDAQGRDDELSNIASAHRGLLRGLWSVNHIVQTNAPLNSLINTSFDSENISDDDEAAFLKKNDLSNGLSFDPATLPAIPHASTPQPNDASIHASKLTTGSTESPQQVGQTADADALVEDGVAASGSTQPTSTESMTSVAAQKLASILPANDARASPAVSAPENPPTEPDGPSIAPAQAAPPLPEDEADMSASAQELVDQQLPSNPAKVVHLPSQEVQEEQLRQREEEEERRRQSDADSKSSQRLAAPQAELASSPSSTVGAYSAATPVPPQDSPDTSPDSEPARVEVPKEFQPSPEEQREKEEHDRLLEEQKELARKQALGDVAETPDEQLKWEEREAAAREAEEKAAREDVGGPEPDSKDARDSTEAEQTVEDMEIDQEQPSVEPAPDAKPVEPPVEDAKAEVNEQPPAQEDGDTIAVAPRTKAPPAIDTSRQHDTPASIDSTPASARPPRMTTRVSSGAMRQKSVSEILGQSQSPPADDSLRASKVMSPEPISPLTQRHPHDNANITQAIPLQPAKPPPRPSTRHRSPSMSYPAIEQLEALKGAADDPNKDYLEPLFRIQAHEAQNSNTKTLPELVRNGAKALSTDDHFTALHERLDFRMLRRIYQLQNANKWSLRQMEKCKEPEQPVTHHDHMMEEMKWMRKDFRAERKLKKNVCAFLAQKCAEWCAAGPEEKKLLQVKVKAPKSKTQATEDASDADPVPDLEQAGDSAPEDELSPPTPRATSPLPTTVVVAPELADTVDELRKSGKLSKALSTLPIVGPRHKDLRHEQKPVTPVSKFVEGKVLPKTATPPRKRSRYDYEDEAEALEVEPSSKRLRDEEMLPPDDVQCALFQDESKPIRERLHSNNAFRPPSEFIMPSTSFYEFRNGSQWIWDDDQKLRKLAKEYSFNWSLIADEMALPTRFKSSAERRTPWECFERWVELESLPVDMKKTVYFKTWFSRLEQSQQAAERRYSQQVAHFQQQAAQTGAPPHIPPRRRIIPTRVEKRKSSRYLWMIDGFRKLAKKREQQQWKQAETARVAAQRKSQTETNQVKMVKMTPQEFSKKRQERDMQMQEAARQHRAKMMEAQRQQLLARQQAQQGGAHPNGGTAQPRPPGANGQAQQPQMQQQQVNGQQVPNANGQASAAQQQQARQGAPVAPQRNGHLAVPQVNGQGIPQAQMQARAGMAQAPNMQQMAQANAQGRNPQYPNGQYPMPNGNMQSPGGTNMTTQQQLQYNQQLLASFQQGSNNQGQNATQNASGQQMSSSPSMPPPPTPQNAPQQLSSGHVPQIIAIQNQLRATNPNISEEQLKVMATQQMKVQSQSSSQARQSAMNAAAGIQPNQGMQQQQYGQNQNAYQRNGQMPNGANGMYANGDGSSPQVNMSPANNSPSQQQQEAYRQKMWQRQQMQMQQMQSMQSPNGTNAQLNGSPSLSQATPASPSVQYSNMNNQMNTMGTPMANMNNQRPPSRSNTPQMQRLGSSGSGTMPTMGNGMQSPGSQMQGSPRNMQASMAR